MSSSGRKYSSGGHKRKKKKEADEEIEELRGSLSKYIVRAIQALQEIPTSW